MVGLGLTALLVSGWCVTHSYTLFVIEPSHPWYAPALVTLQCWLNVGLFIIAHDCMHNALAPGWRRLQVAIGSVCLFIYAGFSYAKLTPAHHQHHAQPGTARDPDYCTTHNDAALPWYWHFVRYYFGLREFTILTLFLVIYIGVLEVTLTKLLLFWALPAVASSFQLFYFGTFLPHRTSGTAFADTHRARSSGFSYLGSLASCYHFGCHHEHHLYPGVPWWYLPHVNPRHR